MRSASIVVLPTYAEGLPKVLLESPDLDEDHQRLLGHVNALIAAIASKAPTGVRSALSELRSETEAHFAREETMMLAAQYPRLKQHCARHQRRLTVSIKQARTMALLPYASDDRRDGVLVASVAQEGLVRIRRKEGPAASGT
jgi:hemerythrin-like metal-binding protein